MYAASADSIPSDDHLLFFIERSINANKAYYYLSVDSTGEIDKKRPVHAFWIMWAKDSTGRTRESLTSLERRLAYGYTLAPDSTGRYLMKLNAFPDRPIRISMADRIASAEIVIDKQPARLQKIFVGSRHGGVIPTVRYIELSGVSCDKKLALRERISP
ncbi:MAG: DUF4833 domain-containing protein [Chitinispirillaceae bacterium]|jgi:hypothetical protein|nr:DUF4833 domain-containing protein [Chitinispirillaceae bacterium]